MIKINELEVLRERITFLQAGDRIRATFNYETNLFDLYDMNGNKEKFIRSVDLRWVICTISRFATFTGHFGEILWDLTQLTEEEVGIEECSGGGYTYKQ